MSMSPLHPTFSPSLHQAAPRRRADVRRGRALNWRLGCAILANIALWVAIGEGVQRLFW